MDNSKDWLWAITGALFLVLVVITFAVAGDEPPAADEGADKVAQFYIDNKDSIQLSALFAGIAMALFVFWGGYLRKVLRAAEGEGGGLSAVAFAGTIIVAVGLAIDQSLSFAMAEAAEDVDAAQIQALQVYWDNDWMPMALGLSIYLIAGGISIVRTGALPKWLGWIAIVLGVAGLTPVGFVAFLGGGIWTLIASIMLTMRARSATA